MTFSLWWWRWSTSSTRAKQKLSLPAYSGWNWPVFSYDHIARGPH